MISTFCPYNLKILRPKVTKNLTNLLKKFCEFSSGSQSYKRNLVFKKSKLVLNLLWVRYLQMKLDYKLDQ